MRKLFGTDGIRGVAGKYPLDERTTFAIGAALGAHLLKSHKGARVVLGMDTRESSTWIADSVARGMQSRGVESDNAGFITTPGVAYLARTRDYAAGIVISASHNPWQDNGIKVFGHDGYKLPDAVEIEIEREIFAHIEAYAPGPDAPTRADKVPVPPRGLTQAYIDWLVASVAGVDLSRLKMLVDCANGAATPIAHELFRACGVNAVLVNDTPNGRNINGQCGALHPDCVAAKIVEENSISREMKRFTLGVTFDGDADRALFSDENGNVFNGDAVMLALARDMQNAGTLRNNTVVATTMSNMGLEKALGRSGIRMLRAPVGDKYVLEEMRKSGATLGGEQSGHIIFRDGDATTGDGLLTALRVMSVMARTGRMLSELVSDLKTYPQVIVNVRVREKKPLENVPSVAGAIAEAEREIASNGRIVIRYSGTEPLARVMIEAESEPLMRRHADAIAGAIQQELGA